MTWETWALILSAVGGPIAGIAAAFIAAHFTRRTGRESNTVAQQAVHVDAREARTHEIAMIIDGFQASLASARTELGEARDELKAARGELKTALADNLVLRDDHDQLSRKVDLSARQQVEMLFHIVALEDLIPNPPGPPARPNWSPYALPDEDTQPARPKD